VAKKPRKKPARAKRASRELTDQAVAGASGGAGAVSNLVKKIDDTSSGIVANLK
jgi:hypothetical protein